MVVSSEIMVESRNQLEKHGRDPIGQTTGESGYETGIRELRGFKLVLAENKNRQTIQNEAKNSEAFDELRRMSGG